ncbi:MAG TPA: alpha/beta fold hydrolase [Acidimicrobiales bacterium]|nr:alpha/beta fold hydrolase [Acidimicrobiales bacterium]
MGRAPTSAVMRDELFRAQWQRALGYAPYEGAEIGECLAVADQITSVDATVWYDRWHELADRVHEAAVRSETSGDIDAARAGFLRASNYYRSAGVFLLGAPVDERLRDTHRSEVAAFRRGVALLGVPAEIVEIPFGSFRLPGYFLRPSRDGAPRRTIVLTGGYDGTAEELYFTSGAAAVARGYNVVAFDGPGQGSMIVDQGVPFLPDWESVVTPVVDWLLARPDVDPARIALMGLSFGGYLAPRAATKEHRFAACISDCGPYDLFETAVARIPGVLGRQLPHGNRIALGLLRRVLRIVMGKPTAGWALRRNVFVHGLTDPLEFFRIAPDYSLEGREAEITCPTLVCGAEHDDLSANAPRLYDALTCEKSYVQFLAADGAGDHCESGARPLFNQTAFDWLDTVMPESSVATSAAGA